MADESAEPKNGVEIDGTSPGDAANGTEVEASPDDALAAARQEAADNYNRFLRAKADLDNIQKRHQRELADRAKFEGEALIRDLLPVVDDLERALEHAAASTGADSTLADGVGLVLRGMLGALRRHGVERLEAEGKPFDPNEHEAVSMVETDEAPAGTVIAVHRPGYRMKDRLLRPAMVSVAKATSEDS
ncbi:MAG TPA: nucleotide exchange factor GrpE [Candidatus Limnocylindrales bacterium]|nr:nucleotide exchange factor GrpE [Candidatus Limnocylindrales bacterium]